MKKPFNSLLAETFEYVSKDFSAFSEQVSHHPPISAYHIEGKNYTSWGQTKGDTKFIFYSGGMMVQMQQEGNYYVKFHKYNDDFIIQKPNVDIYNIIIGTKYLDLSGKIKGLNRTNGQTLELKLKTKRWSTPSLIKGHASGSDGTKLFEVMGCWHD